MAKKKKHDTKKNKSKINPSSLKDALITIRSRFKAGEVERMNDISKIFVSGMYTALGMGYDGWVTKLANPELFTIEDLLKLSDITDTDFDLIWAVVKKEAMANHQKRNIDHLLNPDGIENSDQD